MRTLPRLGIGLGLALGFSGCALGELEGNPLGGGELSVEREQEVTADVASQIRAKIKLVGDPVVLAYLNELGQELVRVTEPQPFVYRFGLLEDDRLNAFTIGGGYVYLNSGVVLQAGDKAELAGVLAHEIAHVRRRHIASRNEGQGLATIATLATLAAVALGGGNPGLIAIPQGLNVALQLKHSRGNEAEADREGVGYLMRAGYDPRGMIRFFERILEASPGGSEIPPYLYSHPAIRERIARGKAQIARLEGSAQPGPGELAPAGGAPPSALARTDARLGKVQARLAALLEPVAGGSGLQARPEFDRSRTDPLLEQARAAAEDGERVRAEELLAQAAGLEPSDPRVHLLRADLAEQRGDLVAAEAALQRAFELDPRVPLVQRRLGLVHKQLGNRTQAVFYLEQAAANFRPGTPARERAHLDIDLLSFPAFDASVLSVAGVPLDGRPVREGARVVWSASLATRFLKRSPAVELRWRAPDGEAGRGQLARTGPLGGLSAELDTRGRAPGRWTLEIQVGDTPVESLSFELVAADASGER